MRSRLDEGILIVADGSLQLLPFAALPDPRVPEWTPLVKDHETTMLPSASVLLACTVLWPWATLTAAVLLYLGLLPLGSRPPGPIRQKFTRPPAPPVS